jgi:hypothetical protein
MLREMDVERLWETTDLERRVLEELLGPSPYTPDHVEVTVTGARRLNVTLQEVDRGVASCRVGGGDWCRRGDLNPHGP